MSVIRVLVVDDSAFARKVIRESLESEPGFEVVGVARDGLEALEQIAQLKPDVVTLDLVMPNLDGLGVLRTLPLGGGAPRCVVVSIADEDSALGIAALQAGATDVVHKPTAQATAMLYDLGPDLRTKVRAAALARVAGRMAPPSAVKATRLPVLARSDKRLVAIGASTGGPQAITRLLRALPASFPVPVAVVVHMPAGYTAAFATRLDDDCELRVVEAADGLVLTPGMATVARAGMHLRIDPLGDALRAHLALEPTSLPHRPSLDVLFESAAWLGPKVLGVVLTGMGDDGTAGARALRAAGAPVLTESESSCVVHGMPRAVKEAGLSSAEAPLEDMARLIAAYL
jgi:two-component system, chemotaxis family, protein-glutamate methylesterase/glutaminase